MHSLIDLANRSWDSSIVAIFASVASLLGVVALVTAVALRPPLIGWIGLGVASAIVMVLAVLATLAFGRLRADAQEPFFVSDGDPRLLVIADSLCSETILCDEIQARLQGAVTVHLVVPVRVSRLHYLTDDESEERRDAEESLLISVRLLQQRGIPATGSIGGDDPLEAMTDALALFPATQVLLVVPPDGESYWLERDLLAKERALTTIDVQRIVVPSLSPEAEREPSRRDEVPL